MLYRKGENLLMVTAVIEAVYRFLWGDLFTIPLGNGNGIGIPLLVLLLILF